MFEKRDTGEKIINICTININKMMDDRCKIVKKKNIVEFKKIYNNIKIYIYRF